MPSCIRVCAPRRSQQVSSLLLCVQLQEVESERDELLGKMEEYEAYIQVRANAFEAHAPAHEAAVCTLRSSTETTAFGRPQGVQDYEQEVRANMDAMEEERAKWASSFCTRHLINTCM